MNKGENHDRQAYFFWDTAEPVAAALGVTLLLVGRGAAQAAPHQSASRQPSANTPGMITEFPIPSGNTAFKIAQGADGNLWFPELNTSKIGRITSGVQLSQAAVSVVTTPGTSPTAQVLTLSNNNPNAVLNWSAAALPSWVSVNPTSGTLAAGGSQQLTLTFTPTSNTPQTSTTTLSLTTASGAVSPLLVPITVVSANASKTWYFAEGFTGGSFVEFLTLANPNAVQANVQVQYYLGTGQVVPQSVVVPANARGTIRVNDIVPNQNVSIVVTADQPIVAERPIYFTYTSISGHPIPGGSDVLGSTQLGTSFDFGYLDTTSLHDTFLTILNQNPVAMNVTITYLAASTGIPTIIKHTVLANTRGTVKVNAEQGLPAGVYSALVTLDQPGLVERPMYLVDSVTYFTGSADIVGVATPLDSWDFAEGFTFSGAGAFSERYLLSNPTSSVAKVSVFFFLSGGGTQTTNLTIQPGAQAVVDANAVLGNEVNNSASVGASQPILAERFMSFDFRGSIPGATDVLGAAQPSNLFLFSEGFTGQGFSEFLTIENPDQLSTATVQVTFLPAGGGNPVVQVYRVAPLSRFTLDTSTVMPGQSFSMIVESNIQIVAERPMCFTFSGGKTGGSDVIGYQP
jgi:hypothetical protein